MPLLTSFPKSLERGNQNLLRRNSVDYSLENFRIMHVNNISKFDNFPIVLADKTFSIVSYEAVLYFFLMQQLCVIRIFKSTYAFTEEIES